MSQARIRALPIPQRSVAHAYQDHVGQEDATVVCIDGSGVADAIGVFGDSTPAPADGERGISILAVSVFEEGC